MDHLQTTQILSALSLCFLFQFSYCESKTTQIESRLHLWPRFQKRSFLVTDADTDNEEETDIYRDHNNQEYNGVLGRSGIDFPILRRIPATKFSCNNLKNIGTAYYADYDTRCQVFHLCDKGQKISFLCPNGTIFDQSQLICDWWYKVECQQFDELLRPNEYNELSNPLNSHELNSNEKIYQDSKSMEASIQPATDADPNQTIYQSNSTNKTLALFYEPETETTDKFESPSFDHGKPTVLNNILSNDYIKPPQTVSSTQRVPFSNLNLWEGNSLHRTQSTHVFDTKISSPIIVEEFIRDHNVGVQNPPGRGDLFPNSILKNLDKHLKVSEIGKPFLLRSMEDTTRNSINGRDQLHHTDSDKKNIFLTQNTFHNIFPSSGTIFSDFRQKVGDEKVQSAAPSLQIRYSYNPKTSVNLFQQQHPKPTNIPGVYTQSFHNPESEVFSSITEHSVTKADYSKNTAHTTLPLNWFNLKPPNEISRFYQPPYPDFNTMDKGSSVTSKLQVTKLSYTSSDQAAKSNTTKYYPSSTNAYKSQPRYPFTFNANNTAFRILTMSHPTNMEPMSKFKNFMSNTTQTAALPITEPETWPHQVTRRKVLNFFKSSSPMILNPTQNFNITQYVKGFFENQIPAETNGFATKGNLNLNYNTLSGKANIPAVETTSSPGHVSYDWATTPNVNKFKSNDSAGLYRTDLNTSKHFTMSVIDSVALQNNQRKLSSAPVVANTYSPYTANQSEKRPHIKLFFTSDEYETTAFPSFKGIDQDRNDTTILTPSTYEKYKLKSTADFRELAQIFSRALSAYLEDPELFRRVLTDVRPTEPSTGNHAITTPYETLIVPVPKHEEANYANFEQYHAPAPNTISAEMILTTEHENNSKDDTESTNEISSFENTYKPDFWGKLQPEGFTVAPFPIVTEQMLPLRTYKSSFNDASSNQIYTTLNSKFKVTLQAPATSLNSISTTEPTTDANSLYRTTSSLQGGVTKTKRGPSVAQPVLHSTNDHAMDEIFTTLTKQMKVNQELKNKLVLLLVNDQNGLPYHSSAYKVMKFKLLQALLAPAALTDKYDNRQKNWKHSTQQQESSTHRLSDKPEFKDSSHDSLTQNPYSQSKSNMLHLMTVAEGRGSHNTDERALEILKNLYAVVSSGN